MSRYTTPLLQLRSAFTVLETLIALGLLSVAIVLAAQLGTQSLTERADADDQLAAEEGLANVLEAARTQTWSDLTPEWATGQRLPVYLTDLLHNAILTIRVEPEHDRPRVKRVTVDLRWDHRGGSLTRTVTTVALFADRTAGGGT